MVHGLSLSSSLQGQVLQLLQLFVHFTCTCVICIGGAVVETTSSWSVLFAKSTHYNNDIHIPTSLYNHYTNALNTAAPFSCTRTCSLFTLPCTNGELALFMNTHNSAAWPSSV